MKLKDYMRWCFNMKLALIIMFVVFVAMQFIRPEKVEFIADNKYEIRAPKDIKQIFETACYDCHSNKINYPWYSDVAPFSWVVINHTKEGVRALNFSFWEKYNYVERNEKLRAIYRTVYSSMPLQSYSLVHKDANLTKAQRKLVRDWTGVRR